MKLSGFRLCVFTVLALTCVAPVLAQSSGSITGTLVDPQRPRFHLGLPV